MARSAMTPTRLVYVRVTSVVLVARRAVRTAPHSVVATQCVDLLSNSFKMVRVTARPVFAQVINDQTGRYCAELAGIRNSVRGVLNAVNAKTPVTVPVRAG